MITAALYLHDNRLCVHVRRVGWFYSRAGFSPNTIRGENNEKNVVEQGKELAKALPKGFLRLVNICSLFGFGKTLMMHIATPSLNDFFWEYVPVNPAREKLRTWQALPFIRTVPCAAYRETPVRQNKDFCFFYDTKLNPSPNFPIIDDKTIKKADYKPSDPNDGVETRWPSVFKGCLKTAGFLHIVTHGGVGKFLKKEASRKDAAEEEEAYFTPEDIDSKKGVPRVVLAECCHSAETGQGNQSWAETMPGRFLNAGAAVYIGSIGIVEVTRGGTLFANCFLYEFLSSPNQSFAAALRKTQKRLARAGYGNPNRAHAVYAAANLNPERNRCADILNAGSLKEYGYRPPSCPREPLPFRVKWPVYALGLLALLQAALFFAQTSLYLLPQDSSAMMILAAAATVVFVYNMGDWFLSTRRKKKRAP